MSTFNTSSSCDSDVDTYSYWASADAAVLGALLLVSFVFLVVRMCTLHISQFLRTACGTCFGMTSIPRTRQYLKDAAADEAMGILRWFVSIALFAITWAVLNFKGFFEYKWDGCDPASAMSAEDMVLLTRLLCFLLHLRFLQTACSGLLRYDLLGPKDKKGGCCGVSCGDRCLATLRVLQLIALVLLTVLAALFPFWTWASPDHELDDAWVMHVTYALYGATLLSSFIESNYRRSNAYFQHTRIDLDQLMSEEIARTMASRVKVVQNEADESPSKDTEPLNKGKSVPVGVTGCCSFARITFSVMFALEVMVLVAAQVGVHFEVASSIEYDRWKVDGPHMQGYLITVHASILLMLVEALHFLFEFIDRTNLDDKLHCEGDKMGFHETKGESYPLTALYFL